MPGDGKGDERVSIAKQGVSAAYKGDEADLRKERRRVVQDCWDTPKKRHRRQEDDGQGEEAERAVPAPRPADSARDTKNDEGQRVHVLRQRHKAAHRAGLKPPRGGGWPGSHK